MLIFEPRTEGHHLTWLRYVAEDLTHGGFKLTLAVDLRPKAKSLVHEQLVDILPQRSIVSAFDQEGGYRGGSKVKSIADCFEESGAHEVFMDNFDEIASRCLRLAAVGVMPPKVLRGRLHGVYFRPRFLANAAWPMGNLIKAWGFHRLCGNSWFKNIYLLDENLLKVARRRYSGPDYYFLPDPWHGNYHYDKDLARQELGIADEKRVFLNYGIGTRRKGLHLIVRALLASSPNSNFMLLCAGKIAKDSELIDGLAELEKRGIAKVINRYVSDREEELCFSASDVVLLPYVKHFGSSGVLSRAAAAGKMVIASDEGLIAKRVSDHGLGWLFASGNAGELRKALDRAMALSQAEMARFYETAHRYAGSCSREAFRQALLSSFQVH